MKKIVAILSVCALSVVMLAGCGGSKSEPITMDWTLSQIEVADGQWSDVPAEDAGSIQFSALADNSATCVIEGTTYEGTWAALSQAELEGVDTSGIEGGYFYEIDFDGVIFGAVVFENGDAWNMILVTDDVPSLVFAAVE